MPNFQSCRITTNLQYLVWIDSSGSGTKRRMGCGRRWLPRAALLGHVFGFRKSKHNAVVVVVVFVVATTGMMEKPHAWSDAAAAGGRGRAGDAMQGRRTVALQQKVTGWKHKARAIVRGQQYVTGQRHDRHETETKKGWSEQRSEGWVSYYRRTGWGCCCWRDWRCHTGTSSSV